MKTNFKLAYLLALFLGLSAAAEAKTVCTMTFNSENEKQVFAQNLSPVGYENIELVPNNKNPLWLKEACQSQVKCDILLVSGHFGGLFFGEGNSQTLSIQSLISEREAKSCGNILDAKAVYLMGCNTLASKVKDHRTIDQYLRVLVNDGFPLNLAENVASARYLNFGQSMGEIMTQIFVNSKMIAGFDSTGPLGAQSAPLLQKAFNNTTLAEKNETGISAKALKTQFANHNMRVLNPTEIAVDPTLKNTMTSDPYTAQAAWKEILSTEASINKYYDFITRQELNSNLSAVIASDLAIRTRIETTFIKIIKTAAGLSAIQLKSLNFLKRFQIITNDVHTQSVLKITNSILSTQIDYVGADQLCEIFKEQQGLPLSAEAQGQINQSIYKDFLNKCRGEVSQQINFSPAFKCLKGDGTYRYDWACLTDNAYTLDIPACQYAKSRNQDPENADDMLWFCYSKMIDMGRLSRPGCLELTHSFSILGNQLKMNWNCLNRL
ncbi:hypothetical protein CIK05_00880 [Bdellovibrio sp. qaytius]|nr:hypothetical protein CIK05_00880 [Bdellovibrio sp. qaytius]